MPLQVQLGCWVVRSFHANTAPATTVSMSMSALSGPISACIVKSSNNHSVGMNASCSHLVIRASMPQVAESYTSTTLPS